MKNFKRVMSIVLVAVLAVGLAACTATINLNVNCDDNLAQLISKAGSQSTPVVQTTAPAQQPTAAPTEAPTQAPATEDTTKAPEKKEEKKDEEKKDSSGELSASSSKEEVVAKYVEVYNATKATGNFIGNAKTSCTALAVDGKENSLVKKVADTAVGGEATSPLPPSNDANPGNECAVKPGDIKEYKYTDNGDGTATIRLDCIETTNSRRFQDPAGDMLDVMEDLAGTLASVPVVSFAEGDVNSNVVLKSSGYCEVTFDKSTNIMTKATYMLYTDADITHVNVKPFITDKNGTASFEYVVNFPA